MRIPKLFTDEQDIPLEHAILHIVLASGIAIAIWSTLANYWLGLDPLLVGASVISSVIMSVLYYLAAKWKLYAAVRWILLAFAFLILPSGWIFNGGISSSMPYYAILFSSMGTIFLSGIRRVLAVLSLIAISASLIAWEYFDPAIVAPYAYPSQTQRYIDVFVGLTNVIVANTFIISMILRQYQKEHAKARVYLQQSQQDRKELEFLSYHDVLTGLYNRTYFEKRLKEFQAAGQPDMGVFMIDVDGLKFVNDTFGHQRGDVILVQAAKVLQAVFQKNDILARIGGDEFAVLLQGVNSREMEQYYRRLQEEHRRYQEEATDGGIPLYMSIGYARSGEAGRSIREMLRDADSKMYREKLYRNTRVKGSIFQTVKQMMAARDQQLNEHGGRLAELLVDFSQELELPQSGHSDLMLFAEFHDVGLIGVPDALLNKGGVLTAEEREQIQRHCEIGYRIAKVSDDLIPIADWILKHHEWWNGSGYPLGLQGEAVPLECRMLAIADAYDAMTTSRPYLSGLTHQAAVAELAHGAGTQFDPQLTSRFIAMVDRSH